MATILIRIGRKYYKARINPSVDVLRSAVKRQMRRGRLASAVRLEKKIRKLQNKNPRRRS